MFNVSTNEAAGNKFCQRGKLHNTFYTKYVPVHTYSIEDRS